MEKKPKNINHFLKTKLLSALKVEKVLDNKAQFEKKKATQFEYLISVFLKDVSKVPTR